MCVVEPRLSTFKDKAGTTGSFKFFASVVSASMEFETREPWWNEFLELWSEAREIVEERHAVESQRLEAVEEQNNEIVLSRMRGLINDEQFLSLPTQRAMRAYALEAIPELEEFTDEFVKSEIQTITAKIHARGLKRK